MFNLRWSIFAELPVVTIFLWYLFYTGVNPLVSVYERVDDLLLLGMLLATVWQIARRRGRLRFPPMVAPSLFIVNGVIVASSLLHPSTLGDLPEFIYRTNRALIILLYVFAVNLDADRVFRHVVWISRFILLVNLPVLLYYLATYNISILEGINNDVVRGFFPFENNDSIAMLLTIMAVHDAHAVLFQKKLNYLWLLAGEYVLLVATMNFKVVIAVTIGLMIVTVLRSRRPIFYATLLLAIGLLPVWITYPSVSSRMGRIQSSPVYIAASTIIEGNVSEYSWFLGTGPGSFTSPMAFENNRYLTGKYGLLALRDYWRDVYKGPTGTLSTWSSSAITLFGEVGVFATFGFVFILLWLTWRCFLQVPHSGICLLGFIMGIYVIPGGIFLDSWSWGYEGIVLMLGAKAAADLRVAERNQVAMDTLPRV